MTATDDDAFLYLTATQVAELCREIDLLDTVTSAFLAVRAGRAEIAPEAALRWTAPDGTAARSLMLPARYTASYGCKIINACVGNPARGLPRAHGLIMLFDPETAAPACLLEAAHISALRTAAVSVAALRAVRELSAVRSVAFLGCGRQAYTHLQLLGTRASPETVIAYDVHAGRAAGFAEQVRQLLPRATVTVTDGPEAAVRGADITIAATTTTTPYVALDWMRPGAVFVNVSLDDATEELLLGCERLFVDDWSLVSEDQTRLLGRLARAGRVTGPGGTPPPGGRSVDADLADLLADACPGQVTEADRAVINPFGMGVHDIALAAQVYSAASASGVGHWLPR
ncbi:MAG TPA: ornithine cyclodeaminase [Streptosporangiaceae bacterium]|nr:ornithine cyclodeaminase [Streptosporangiaceae bacterium]